MTIDERFREALEVLERRFLELAEAGEDAARSPSRWSAWCIRFNQLLLADRQRFAIVLEPPPDADARLEVLYRAGAAIRDLCEAMDASLQGRTADVDRARDAVEAALAAAREAIPGSDKHANEG